MKRVFLSLAVLSASQVAAQVPASGTPPGTMMVFDLAGDGIAMTSPQDGVRFDLDADGVAEQISWTLEGSDDAILALDANKNGTIDNGREVVGRQFRLPGRDWASVTGAEAICFELQNIEKAFVLGGGRLTADLAQIDQNDSVFEVLRLWTDRDHNGRSAPSELSTLPDLDVTLINASFSRPRAGAADSVDKAGNRRLFGGSFMVRQSGVQFRRLLDEIEPAR